MPTRVPSTGSIHCAATRFHNADNLVAGHDRQFRIGQVAVDHMQIGTANRAGLDPHQNLSRSGTRQRPFLQPERLSGGM